MSEIRCDDVLNEIEHYLHGELDRERSSQLAKHIVECSPCFDRAEFQRRLKEIVRMKCRSAPPEHLMLKIQQAIRVEHRPEEIV